VAALVASAPAPAKSGRPTIVYQGHTSALRGLHFLPDIIERCAKISPRPHFVVQIQSNDPAPNNPLRPTLDRLAKLAGDDLTLVNGELSATDYFSLLAAADIILLPYSPTFYGCGSSGVFTEAASAGKVVVVSQGTVPARQGREFALGVVTASQWTSAAMAQAVANAVQNLPALKEAAARGAPRFRADQCARVLWDKLLAAVEAKAPATRAAAAA
jgi:glycosyltransferase involved in cell wall biosynthesis